MNFLKAFRVMGLVTTWFEKAMRDQVIDAQEVAELVTGLGDIFGMKVQIGFPMKQPTEGEF